MEAPLKKVILPNGAVDWEAFQELVTEKDFLVYDPPKKRPFWALSNLNLFTPRSPIGVGFPCCVAESVRARMRSEGHDVQHAYISKPDEWFLKMLEPPAEGNHCPELLRGVWWMKDNVANETLLSFESAHWGSPGTKMEGVGIKHVFKNWSKGSSMWGSMLARSHEEMFGVFKISPDLQWINLDMDNWIYILQAGDKLVDPSGKPVPFRPGDDLLRVTWNDQGESTTSTL